MGKTGDAIAVSGRFAATVAESTRGVGDVLLDLVPESDHWVLSDRSTGRYFEQPEGLVPEDVSKEED